MTRRKLRSAASRRSRRNRNRGSSGEREFAALLSAAIKQETRRKLGASRNGGDDVEIDMSKFPACDIKVRQGFSFEVKRRRSVAIDKWLRQAAENVGASAKMPVVVCRGDNAPWRACLNLDDFFRLLRCALNIAD